MILYRYISAAIVRATLLVMAFLLGVDLFILFFRELSSVGHGSMTLGKLFVVVLLELPADAYSFFPMACFLGVLIGLGRLSSSAELIVMRASGFSNISLMLAVLWAGAQCQLAGLALGEGLAPLMKAKAGQYKLAALGDVHTIHAYRGVWLKSGDWYVHLDAVLDANHLQGVTAFSARNGQLSQAVYAPFARQSPKNKGQWLLQSAVRTQFKPPRTRRDHLKAYMITLPFDPVMLSFAQQPLEQFNLYTLHQVLKQRADLGLYTGQWQLAFYQRLLAPITAWILMCLAIPFVLGVLRASAVGTRLLCGIVLGFVFYVTQQFIGPLALLYQFPVGLSALAPSILFAAVCAILFRRLAH